MSKFGSDNPNWRGGRSIASNGYILIRVGTDHHLADVRGYAYEHRLVAEEAIGRRLRPGEVVHHVDHDKQNNDPDNLVVMTTHEHRVEHRHANSNLRLPDEPNPEVQCECGCGGTFTRYDSMDRPRRFLPGHNSRSDLPDRVIEALGEHERKRGEIARDLDEDADAVGRVLNLLKSEGRVEKRPRQRWARVGSRAQIDAGTDPDLCYLRHIMDQWQAGECRDSDVYAAARVVIRRKDQT